MSISLDDVDQIHHITRLAILAMAARAVASNEFESSPEVQAVHLVVARDSASPVPAVDLTFYGTSSVPLGGMAL